MYIACDNPGGLIHVDSLCTPFENRIFGIRPLHVIFVLRHFLIGHAGTIDSEPQAAGQNSLFPQSRDEIISDGEQSAVQVRIEVYVDKVLCLRVGMREVRHDNFHAHAVQLL